MSLFGSFGLPGLPFVPGSVRTTPLVGYPVALPSLSSVSSSVSEVSVSITTDGMATKTENIKVPSLPVFNYYSPNTLLYVGEPVYYSFPVYKNISYLDVNADRDLQKKVVRHFFSQLYNKWVPNLYPRLLNYIKISNRDVHLVKSENEAKNNTTKEEDFHEKINYLADYVYTKTDIFSELSTYVDKKGLNWWNLRDHNDDIELLLVKKLEEKLKDMVME